MIKILAIDSPNIDGVTWWRNVRPLTQLQRDYPNLDIKFTSERVTPFELMQADLIIMFRPIRPTSLEFLKRCKNPAFGLKIILDIDDNLWRIPPGHPNEIEYTEYAETLREIYAKADGIWCSTDAIMPFADAMDGRGRVVPNAILPADLPSSPCPYRGIVCWRGSIANVDDIESRAATRAFLENREKFMRWVFWGYSPKNMRGDGVVWRGYEDTVAYFGALREQGINIMWKPLVRSEFNDSKSNIAWIEATMAGGICVTNYAGLPGWEMAVDKFSNNADFIAHQWALSRDWILEHYNLEKVNRLRYDHIIKTLES